MPKQKRIIRFGIIGLGLMGREFASAAARWCHLLDLDFAPQITAICDANPVLFEWFTDNGFGESLQTTDYRQLLDRPDIDAVYCAVPHNLHEQMYIDIISAGKHLLGEKPFGIDLKANQAIQKAMSDHPEVVVACSSEFPFYPGAQRIVQAIRENQFGRIIEVQAGFLHSSDLDPNKKINWKRMVSINGEYGCMGDLGLHALHIPLRAGWVPMSVFAALNNIVTERYDSSGNLVPCETWDNATLICDVDHEGSRFPMTIQTYRIAPGETNTWFLRVVGTEQSIEFSTKYPKTLKWMDYEAGGEQSWRTTDLGYSSCYPTITGGIFEFGFTDSLLQMWAAFCDQLSNGISGMRQPFYCATPQETHYQHQVLTAALASHAEKRAVSLDSTVG
ncbi:MAG: Gfo/Idh/MocA family oxidoreductase [Chloroflexi bacterium]|nr:Gfo/Idh/MocA family oxidoreductase [Chloroflexota bacterium]